MVFGIIYPRFRLGWLVSKLLCALTAATSLMHISKNPLITRIFCMLISLVCDFASSFLVS